MTEKIVPCPRCKKPTPYSSDNPYRPFCSDRCKLIDLGDWASEKFRVASDDPPEEGEDAANGDQTSDDTTEESK